MSLSLIIGALVVFTVAGVVVGVLSATRGRIVGQVLDVVSTVGIAVPNFWLAVILVAIFAVELPLFPATGYVFFADSPYFFFLSLVLPGAGAGLRRHHRRRQADPRSDAARHPEPVGAHAARQWRLRILDRLQARPAQRGRAVVTVVGTIFVGSLSGSVVVENIFVLPGLGSQSLASALQADLPVVQGIAVYFTIIVVVVNVVIDIATTILNPKVREP